MKMDNAEPTILDHNIISDSLLQDGKTLPPLLIPPTNLILLRSSIFADHDIKEDFDTKKDIFNYHFGDSPPSDYYSFEDNGTIIRPEVRNVIADNKNWHGLKQDLQMHFTKTDKDREHVNSDEVFSIIRNLRDPEYPDTTLEQLSVVSKEQITIDSSGTVKVIGIRFTPTVPHCSQATIIGLSIRKMMEASLGEITHRLYIEVEPGTHHDYQAITKQINDKERIGAAMESPNVRRIVFKAMKGSFTTTNINGQLWRRIEC